MKNLLKLLGIAAVVTAIGFSMAGCNNGGGDGDGEDPQVVTYSGIGDDGSTYTLVITEGARYVAQVGDSYVLTVTKDGTTKTSSGTVTVAGETLTLTPSSSEAPPFTVTVSSSDITAMTDIITFDNGDTAPAPTTVKPNDGSGNNPDPTVNPIEAAFTNMLKANFVSGSNMTVESIIKMSNWGQINSEYSVKSTKDGILYSLPSSFGTVQVMSDGAAVIISGGAVLMTGPDASIIWGTATGDITSIVISGSDAFVLSGPDAKTVIYPYTVSYPSGSDAQIKGKLNVMLIR